MSEQEIKAQVRQFYNQVGWQMESEGFYQNARYEDLRPVSREYIHKCHLRVNRHIRSQGKYLLDAGSGPIQYPEYLTYSAGYQHRLCVDISIVALKEARKRIGEHGLFVVADVANLPFKEEVFDGLVSLHTLHHLPFEDKAKAYAELYRVLMPGRSGVVVNGWTYSPLMARSLWLVRLMERLGKLAQKPDGKPEEKANGKTAPDAEKKPVGTFIHKQDMNWLRESVDGRRFEVFVWRSVSVRWLRAMIHSKLAGKLWLRLLFWLEERYPRYFGEKGQYPLVVIYK
ncbi:class I SAM-dependent methyltransferase [Ornatilinea apprima]|uniref:class I SAM-dependent methyltransferase n=1 Tax=Ornatilinea apprima TaxID=1134406 RepID=UPI0009467488|nr:class I SAM-dependent methyltransferase [Ornatilinea apprima]